MGVSTAGFSENVQAPMESIHVGDHHIGNEDLEGNTDIVQVSKNLNVIREKKIKPVTRKSKQEAVINKYKAKPSKMTKRELAAKTNHIIQKYFGNI